MMRLIVPVSDEPVTVSELAWNLRLMTDPTATYTGVDADFLAALISAAREDAENYTERHWATRTVTIRFDCFASRLVLPRDLLEVSAIDYIDADDVTQSLAFDSASYTTVPAVSEKLELVFLKSYLAATPLPALADRPNAVEITCVLGQPSLSGVAYIPSTVKLAILLIASHWYKNRESVIFSEGSAKVKAIAQGYAWLLDSHKHYGVG